MAVPFKPDNLIFYNRNDNIAPDLEATSPSFDNATAIPGYLDNLTTGTAFERWGIEINNPAVYYCDLEYKGVVSTGNRAEGGGRTFEVRAEPRINGVTGHLEIILQEVV